LIFGIIPLGVIVTYCNTRRVYTRRVCHVKRDVLRPTTKQAFGKRVRKAREGLGLTQAQLGTLVAGPSEKPFSQKAVSEWEAGLAEPDIETLGRLAVVLTTTVGWLVAGEGKPPVLTGRKAKETSDELVKRAEELKAVKGA
jgi:transcriptional regulator with XRE-family HTH domain